MKFITLAAALLSGLTAVNADCNHDNCYRAVLGTFRGLGTYSSQLADCTSFLGTSTVTSVTATSTVTSTYTKFLKRAVSTPTAIPTYASACSDFARYSSACSCGGVTQVTTTTKVASTVTTTTTYTPSNPATCNNQGMQYAIYADTQTANSNTTDPLVDFAVVKSKTPQSTGVVPTPGKSSGSETDFLETWRGYIYAPESGSYKFFTAVAEEASRTWVGAAAYSGWSDANSNAYYGAVYTQFGRFGTGGTFTVDFQEGKYYPVRIGLKGGSVSPNQLIYAITSPSGVQIADNTAGIHSNYLVQFSCDGTAPRFQPYGQET